MTNATVFDQLGRLLLELGWIAPDQLQDALTQSKKLGLPLGLVLVSLGRLSLNELKAAVEAQSSVRDGLLDPIHAVMALTLVGWSSIALRTALMFLGLQTQKENHANKLGQLLTEAECISELDRIAAINASDTIGLPVGQVLLLQQTISENCLKMALEVQDLVRKQKITREEAIRSLKLTYSNPPKSSQERITIPLLPELRLGELLVLATVVSRDDIKMALEVAQTNKRHLGEILSVFALVPSSILTTALETQRLLQRGELSIDEAVSVVGQAYHKGISLPVAIKNCRRSAAEKPLSVASFLQMVGVMNERDINKVSDGCLDNSAILIKFMESPQPDTLFAVNAAARLKFLVKSSVLTLDAACFVFHHCMQHKTDVDQFLHQSGWYHPVEPGSNVVVAHNGFVAVV